MASQCTDRGMSDGKIKLLRPWISDAFTSDQLMREIRYNYLAYSKQCIVSRAYVCFCTTFEMN